MRLILRLFFHLLYHQFAWSFDLVAAAVSLGMWKQWVNSALPYLDGPRLLEIGHGPGHLLQALSEKGMSAIGLDESRWMGRLALKNLRSTQTTTELVNGYAHYLPFKSASFNQVVSTFPAEFIFQPAVLAEIHRLLVEGGCLVVLPFAWITGTSPAHRLARCLFRFTNQVPDWDERFVAPFQSAGFRTLVDKIELEHSALVLIRAFKLG